MKRYLYIFVIYIKKSNYNLNEYIFMLKLKKHIINQIN